MKYLFLVVLVVFSSCEYYSNINYVIANNTSEKFDLIIKYTSKITDTKTLEISEEYRFDSKSGIGAETSAIMDGIDSIYVDSIAIQTISGRLNKNDLKSISEWNLLYPNAERSDGIVFKSITDDDLE